MDLGNMNPLNTVTVHEPLGRGKRDSRRRRDPKERTNSATMDAQLNIFHTNDISPIVRTSSTKLKQLYA